MSDIEKRVLHELVKNTEHIKTALNTTITDAYFLYPDTKNLFRIIKHNFDTYGTVLESDTLQAWLRKSSKMSQDEKSKVAVLFEAVRLLPDSSDHRVVFDEFRSYFKTNSIKSALEEAVSALHDGKPDEALTQLKTDMVTLERSMNPFGHEKGYLGENVEQYLAQYLDAKEHPEKYRGIELGFRTLDATTNGLPKGSVTIIMGKAKSAKSVLMVNIAYHNLMKGKRVYYHVNEGGRSMVLQRLACRATGLTMDSIERHTLSDAEFAIYSKFFRDYDTSKQLYIDSVPRSLSSASYMERKLEELKTDGPVDFVIVDYMSLMKAEDKNAKSGWERYGAISMDLKDLAMKTGIPIVTIMHVNRPGAKDDDKDHFDLEDMGLSYEPSKNVDLVMSWRINTDELKAKRNTQGLLSIQASRFCNTGDSTLKVDTSHMKIEEYDLTKVLH